MKFIPILFVSICLVINVSAQRKIEKFFNYQWKACHKQDASFYSLRQETDSGFVVTDYFLGNGKVQMTGKYSDSTGKIRNGNFTYYYPNGQISALGRYRENKKDGLWRGFYADGRLKDSAVYNKGEMSSAYIWWFNNGSIGDSIWVEGGQYYEKHWHQNGLLSSSGAVRSLQGKRLGDWIFYHYNGKVSAQIKYNTEGEMVNAKYFDEQGNDVTETATAFANPYKDPLYKDWMEHMRASLKITGLPGLKTPGKAVVVVSFYIDEEGKVKDPTIKVPLHPKYDEVAIELVKSGPKWARPVTFNRRLVGVSISQPVFFNVK